jgi:hypothetical protein
VLSRPMALPRSLNVSGSPQVFARCWVVYAVWLFAVVNPIPAAEPAPRWDLILPVAGPASDATLAEAELALRDTFTLQGVQGVAARRAEGGFDWDDQGPRDDPEWAWFFNRHGCFAPLTRAYLSTGDNRYADFIFASLDDWILQHPAPGRMSFSAAWRPLEAARRILDSWTLVYLKLGDHPSFTHERRARFLASVHAHGEQLRHHHALYGNHLITEMLALAQLSLVFTADGDSGEWLRYSLDQLERTYADQVYPDGAHSELAAHYQRVVALNYQRLLNLLEVGGSPQLAAAWRPRVRTLWAYLAAVMKPDHGNPLNNDSDQENVARLLRDNAPDLAEPTPPVSNWLPYAGQAVFRSRDAQSGDTLWSFFDAGPRGTDHDHADRLHLSVSVGTRDFLVDNGRYTYAPGAWRDYFAGPTGHNVVLFDGQGADQGPKAVGAPDSLGRFFRHWDLEIAYGDTSFSTADNARAGDWRRLVIHVRNQGWIVVDRMAAFRPATLSTLWHWEPVCDALPADSGIGQIIRHGAGSLRLQVASSRESGVWQVVRGAKHPVQGWSSDRFNFKTPASCTLYTQRVAKPVTNVWLISPNDEHPLAATLDVTFAPDGQLVIRARFAKADFELRLDPEQPEGTLSSRSRPRGEGSVGGVWP